MTLLTTGVQSDAGIREWRAIESFVITSLLGGGFILRFDNQVAVGVETRNRIVVGESLIEPFTCFIERMLFTRVHSDDVGQFRLISVFITSQGDILLHCFDGQIDRGGGFALLFLLDMNRGVCS